MHHRACGRCAKVTHRLHQSRATERLLIASRGRTWRGNQRRKAVALGPKRNQLHGQQRVYLLQVLLLAMTPVLMVAILVPPLSIITTSTFTYMRTHTPRVQWHRLRLAIAAWTWAGQTQAIRRWLPSSMMGWRRGKGHWSPRLPRNLRTRSLRLPQSLQRSLRQLQQEQWKSQGLSCTLGREPATPNRQRSCKRHSTLVRTLNQK
mmetsp:Transcript_5012/g.15460  ORF Transcript_5012/g.15460 Transcript_5012/m.15460 type:complete len:205 (+) Transcript_5012:279-893(+)